MKKFAMAGLVVMAMVGATGLRAQEAPKFPEPQKEHEWLKQFIGDWESESEAIMAPGQPPMKWKGTASARSLAGFWVVSEGKADMMGRQMAYVLTLGYDPQKKKYIGTWIDSIMNHLWTYEGTLDAAGKVLTLEAEGPNPTAPGKTGKFRDVFEFKSKDHKVLTAWIQGDDGKWTSFMTSHYRRKNNQTQKSNITGNNRIVHFEIPANEPEKLTKFYADLFGWKFQKAPGMEYWLCDTGSEGPGINGAVMKRQNAQQPLTNYVNVPSIDAAIEKATNLGAQVALPKMPVPGVGAVAAIVDPQGNVCGLFEAKK